MQNRFMNERKIPAKKYDQGIWEQLMSNCLDYKTFHWVVWGLSTVIKNVASTSNVRWVLFRNQILYFQFSKHSVYDEPNIYKHFSALKKKYHHFILWAVNSIYCSIKSSYIEDWS